LIIFGEVLGWDVSDIEYISDSQTGVIALYCRECVPDGSALKRAAAVARVGAVIGVAQC
jgi:hypothetical protein